jgi:hypothetical protein
MRRSSTTFLAFLLAASAPLAAADDHAGHDHAEHAHGSTTAIGTVTIGAFTVAAAGTGAMAMGKDWYIELKLTPTQPAAKAIRIWVGAENARGSVKAKAALEHAATGEYSAHVEIPAPMPADARLWIALETADGQPTKGSIAITTAAAPSAAHEHGPGDGHNH